MERVGLLLRWLLIACTLLTQTGCREQVRSQSGSGPALAAREPAAGTAQDHTANSARLPAAESSQDQGAEAPGGPKITFKKLVYDFGEVSPGKECTGEFKFANTGDSLLRITEVKKCCGIVTELDQEELTPGQTAVLKVEYRPGPGAGTMRRQLYVSSNDEAHPKVALTIKAKIVPKVTCEPQRLALLLKGENAGCPPITLTSVDNQPFTVRAFTATDNCLTADVDTSAQATRLVLRPTANLEKLQNHASGLIRIAVTHPQCDRIDVPFSVMPKFGFNPSAILVFNAEPETPIVRDVSLMSNYGEEFEVASVSSKHGSVKVLHQSKTGNAYHFQVEIMPPLPTEVKDNSTFADVLYVNIRGGTQLPINTYGTYAKGSDRPTSPRTER